MAEIKNKIKVLNHKEELEKYLAGAKMSSPDHYEHQMNILINDHRQDWYAVIGKRMCEQFNGNLPIQLKGFEKKNKDTSWKTTMRNMVRGKNKNYTGIAIFLLTSVLNKPLLKELFGEPLLHDKFGEGFDEDESQEAQFASYFIEILGIKTHIGYDRRGTTVAFGKYKGEIPLPEMAAFCIAQIVEEIKALGHQI